MGCHSFHISSFSDFSSLSLRFHIGQLEVGSETMSDNSGLITRKDIEEKFAGLKEEADEIGGPSVLSRRLVAAGAAILILTIVYFVGKRRGERTKTFVEIIRAE